MRTGNQCACTTTPSNPQGLKPTLPRTLPHSSTKQRGLNVHCKEEVNQQKHQTVPYPREPNIQIHRWQGGTSQPSDFAENVKVGNSMCRVSCDVPWLYKVPQSTFNLSQSTQSPVTLTMCAPIRWHVFRSLSMCHNGGPTSTCWPER